MIVGDTKMSVLLIEDDEIDAESVRRSLPRQTELVQATTLHAALEILNEQSQDLVLLDPGLPDSSGVDSFERIRAAAPKMPIVVLTGLEDQQLALQIIRLGAQDYLLKNQLDDRSVQSLYFAVERGRLLERLQQEQLERERLALELREQEQSLAHLNRVALMGELVAEISHEVSQPLAVISTLATALEAVHQQPAIDRANCIELAEKITEASSHAGQILKRLKQFIRNESPDFEAFAINDLIIATSEFLEFERRRVGVEISYEFAEPQIMAYGNTTQIQQVIVNLLRNAFEAMKSTAKPLRKITARAFRDGDLVVVEVSDSGTGLQLDLDSAFSAFKTTKSEGLGMGLAICSRIIRCHQGKISVVPSDEQGTTFRIELPRAENEHVSDNRPGG